MPARVVTFTAAVIAGGKSSRFGSDKRWARIGDETLLARAVHLATALTAPILLLAEPRSMPAAWRAMAVADVLPDKGPLGGLYTAMLNAKTDYVLTIPCDMPLLRKEVYEIMLRSLPSSRPLCASSPDGIQPLVSIWPVRLREAVCAQIQDGDFRLHAALDKAGAHHVNMAEAWTGYTPDVFININCVADLDKVKGERA